MSSIYDVIDSKVVKHAEIVVCLFDHCNLRCAFCSQEHDSLVGTTEKEILSKVDGIVKWINENTRSTDYKIHIMGGELFQDSWINLGYLNIYQKFIDQIRSQVPQNKNILNNFVTNLVFENTEPVLDFLTKNNLKFSISYDPRGRFATKEEFEIFKRNIEIFRDKIEIVSLVMTKQNIRAVQDGDEYFDYLYSILPMHWDSFLPSVEMSEKMMPAETELLSFYKLLVDKYPDTMNMDSFLSDEPSNRMWCTRGNSYTVLKDNTVPKGCSGSVLLRDGQTDNASTGEIVINFFKTYDCFSCEYYKKCTFTCFIQNDYKKINKDLGKCVFKEVYKYVDGKKRT